MIEIPIKYDPVSIKTFFGNKRFLMETVLEQELPNIGIQDLFSHIRVNIQMSNKERKMINLLRVYKPALVQHFIGLKKFSAEWWIACIELHPITTGTIDKCYLGLIGWKNNHGTQTFAYELKTQTFNLNVETRLQSKIEQGYKKEYEVKKLSLLLGPQPLPTITELEAIDTSKIDSGSIFRDFELGSDSLKAPIPRERVSVKKESVSLSELPPLMEPPTSLMEPPTSLMEPPTSLMEPPTPSVVKEELSSVPVPKRRGYRDGKRLKRKDVEQDAVKDLPREFQKTKEDIEKEEKKVKVSSFKEKMKLRKKESDWL